MNFFFYLKRGNNYKHLGQNNTMKQKTYRDNKNKNLKQKPDSRMDIIHDLSLLPAQYIKSPTHTHTHPWEGIHNHLCPQTMGNDSSPLINHSIKKIVWCL